MSQEEWAGAKKKRTGCSRNPPSNSIGHGPDQSVQRRSPRNLIWSSEACVKVGNGLLTTL